MQDASAKPLNLGNAAMSLADAVKASIAAIYQLQSDLCNNALDQSEPILDELRNSRTKLHGEFDDHVTLLADSLQYAKDYIKLCESTHALESRLVFAKDLFTSADKIRKKATNVRNRHETIVQYFLINKTKIANALRSGEKHELAADKSACPDGPDALAKSYEEFEKIGVYLQDVVLFWEDHYGDVSQCTSRDALQVFLEQGSSATSKVWEDCLPLLKRGIESITHSSDMVLVNPKMSIFKYRSAVTSVFMASHHWTGFLSWLKFLVRRP